MYRNNCLNEYVYVNWSNFQLSFLRANWEMFRTVSKSCDVPRASKPSARQATSSVYFRKPHLQDIESERIESDDNVTITSSNFLRKEKWRYSLSESFPSDERNFIDFRKKNNQNLSSNWICSLKCLLRSLDSFSAAKLVKSTCLKSLLCQRLYSSSAEKLT